ncbi:MAG TPA: hydroxyisourate hydrolase [Candidatus Rubrimentiphilum sp.]|nr:hydroxyisourate hydrolase [Candidatus Rubrimentiphilum sp.]
MISTHVLDTSRGEPARGVTVRLFRIDGDERELLATAETDGDGRIAPIFGGELEPATYVLLFSAGAYFRAAGVATFFDEIPIRFLITQTAPKLHIPLLLAPFGYTTYRGS